MTEETHIQIWQKSKPVRPPVDVVVKYDWIINTHRANWQTYVLDNVFSQPKGE